MIAAERHGRCHKCLNSAIFKTTPALTFRRFAASHKYGTMRDIFEEIFENQPLDPTESARRNMRPKLRTRFYQAATVGGAAEGFPVLLDGRPVRTPARASLAAPVRELAAAIAAEWQAQQDSVDPAAMPLTRLANTIIDGVAPSPGPVAAEVEKYL